MTVDLTEAVEAAARSLWRDTAPGASIPFESLAPDVKHLWREHALAAAQAAEPLLAEQYGRESAIRCPVSPAKPDGTPHTVVGCGSTNVAEDDSEPGLYDCLDCGISFRPDMEPERRLLDKLANARQHARDSRFNVPIPYTASDGQIAAYKAGLDDGYAKAIQLITNHA